MSDNKMMAMNGDDDDTERGTEFQHMSSNGDVQPSEVWRKQTYAKAGTMSPLTTSPFVSGGRPSLRWLTIVVLVILNSVLFVLYILDAIGVGFRSPITLVSSSGGLFLLFCVMSLSAVYRFRSERVMQDWLRMVYITVCFTFINLVTFLTFLIWAIKHPGFWKEIDFDDDPKAHDGYVAANAFAAALFVVGLVVLWTAMVLHYYFQKLLETMNIAIIKGGSAGSLEDIMRLATDGGQKIHMKYERTVAGGGGGGGTTKAGPYQHPGRQQQQQQQQPKRYGEGGDRNTGSPYGPKDAEANKWRG